MHQLIYRSQPFGYDKAMLAGILLTARRNNPRLDITGALICRHDLYLQLIEGPKPAIEALFARIAEDDRHNDVRLLLSTAVDRRMFPDWAMLDDTPDSMFWSPDEVAAGAIEQAGPLALVAAFAKVAGSSAR